VLYDAEGDFDRNFDWWKEFGKHRLVEPQLPFENGRSDLLTGSGSRLDIENINLLATLLVHAQYQGYWSQLGMQFQEEMEASLQRHVLSGLVDAPWVRTDDPESDDDEGFFAALQELVAYAFEESVRIKKKGRLFLAGMRYQPGHLTEFCRKCSLCFRSIAVSYSGNPACSIKEVARDSCSSTRLGTHRYSGDDSQSGCGTQANTYSDKHFDSNNLLQNVSLDATPTLR
jgi:hypothetical protein